MGLKSGSRESGIDESEEDDEEEPEEVRTEADPDFKTQSEEVSSKRESREDADESGSNVESEGVSESKGSKGNDSTGVTGTKSQADSVEEEAIVTDRTGEDSDDIDTVEGKSNSGGQFSVDSLPYKLRRQNVNEGREQVPYFLRPEVTEKEEKLKRTLEDELGETVYKSDYREAAMVVAQRNPELIAEVLREWGYDLPE